MAETSFFFVMALPEVVPLAWVVPSALVVALVPLFIEEPDTPMLEEVLGGVLDEVLVDGELPYVDELLVSVPVEYDDGVVLAVVVEDAGAWVVADSLFLFFL